MSPIPEKPVRYHHFILLIWEERDNQGQHLAWRLSIQESHQEARIGFKNIEELSRYLERWLSAAPPNCLPQQDTK
jgi:hypothetical protein